MGYFCKMLFCLVYQRQLIEKIVLLLRPLFREVTCHDLFLFLTWSSSNVLFFTVDLFGFVFQKMKKIASESLHILYSFSEAFRF